MRAELLQSNRKRPRAGFSLIEILIALAIAMLCMAGTLQLIRYVSKRQTAMNFQTDMETQAKRVAAYLTADAQVADAVVSLDETTLELNAITFSKADSDFEDNAAIYEFVSDSGKDLDPPFTLTRTYIAADGTETTFRLLSGVAAYSFKTFDSEKNETDAIADAYFVQITADLNRNTTSIDSNRLMETPIIFLRNK